MKGITAFVIAAAAMFDGWFVSGHKRGCCRSQRRLTTHRHRNRQECGSGNGANRAFGEARRCVMNPGALAYGRKGRQHRYGLRSPGTQEAEVRRDFADGRPTCSQIARRNLFELAATKELRSTSRVVSPLRSLIDPPASRTQGSMAPMSHGFISGSTAASMIPRHSSAY